MDFSGEYNSTILRRRGSRLRVSWKLYRERCNRMSTR